MAKRNKRNWRGNKFTEERHLLDAYRNVHVDPDSKREVDEMFDKKFTYTFHTDWGLPPHNDIFTGERWADTDLQEIKTLVNQTKNELSELDIERWHQHTQTTHRAGLVGKLIRNSFKPELCTQAWCKFHEIIGTYELIKPVFGAFSSVHICEAPGAFIASLNHRLKTSGLYGRSVQWQWLGNTLNPYYEGNNLSSMIDDDRFIFDTLDRWCFGDDNSGDIMRAENVAQLVKTCDQIQPVLLVTADGSIDCANNPAEQESLVSQLHYCELVTSLAVLATGGSLVIKMFTLLEDNSISFMYLLNVFFNEVNVIKPVTSKPGNSEVYVVAVNFKGIDQNWRDQLTLFVGAEDTSKALLPRPSVPASFLENHRQCCARFCAWQCATIEKNIRLYKVPDPAWRGRLEAAQQYCAAEYVRRFHVTGLTADDRVVPPYDKVDKKRRGNKAPRPCVRKRHAGSYANRTQHMLLPWKQQVSLMNVYDLPEQGELFWLCKSRSLYEEEVKDWSVEVGKPIDRVLNSRFCDNELLTQYNTLLAHAPDAGAASGVEPEAFDYTWAFSILLPVFRTFPDSPTDDTADASLVVVTRSDSEKWSHFIECCGNLQCGITQETTETRDPGVTCLFLLDSEPGSSIAIVTDHLKWLIQHLVEGDSALLMMDIPLTRVGAGCVFLLYAHFKQVAMFHDGRGVGNQVYVACVGFSGCAAVTAEHVQHACDVSSKAPGRLLSFVPIHVLHEQNFIGYIQKQNDLYLKKKINLMINSELANDDEGTSPTMCV